MTEVFHLDVKPAHLDEIRRILSKHVPAFEVIAFGSRVRGDARPWSDLDLAVSGPTALHWNDLGKLREAFQESELPFRVEVMDWDTASPEFKRAVEQDCTVLQPRQ